MEGALVALGLVALGLAVPLIWWLLRERRTRERAKTLVDELEKWRKERERK